MSNYYDIVFLTYSPAFYKLNLFNEIAKRRKIFVIFTCQGAKRRNSDFYNGLYDFEFILFNNNNKIKQLAWLCRFLKKNHYKNLIIGGWRSVYMWLAILLSPAKKNSIVVESSYLESSKNGFRGYIKKIFLKGINKAYVPGESNKKLLQELHFNKQIVKTMGVGIFNIVEQPVYVEKKEVKNFLYVGRLSEEKNLELLIKVFNELPNLKLNIIGFGPLEQDLCSKSSMNTIFWGAINNKDLSVIYQSNDVFILPSIYEPWGLVIEEALNNGLPVIVSNRVGCVEELINEKNGIVFPFNSHCGLREAVLKMTNLEFYNCLRKNISENDFNLSAENQINTYI